MFCVKATIYVYSLDEYQKDLITVHGFTHDSGHVYEKIYEIDCIRDSMYKLLSLLDYAGVSPYNIELEKQFFDLHNDHENNCSDSLDKL